MVLIHFPITDCAFLPQDLVPEDVLPNEFIRAIKYADYSSVSSILCITFLHFRSYIGMAKNLNAIQRHYYQPSLLFLHFFSSFAKVEMV